MCGLLFSSVPGLTNERFLTGLKLMSHRGPDALEVRNIGHEIKIGHCRLSILDLDSRSNQPFYSNNGHYVIIYNGEIYNFRELAQKHNIELRTTSDTELVLELYLKLGPSMLSELIGMFSIIIIDTRDFSYFVARDRLGVKPLYVHSSPKGEIFSSEIRPILEFLPTVKWDHFALEQYRGLRGFFNNRTPYSDIEMFPAGTYSLNGKRVRYWSLPEIEQPAPSDDELADLLFSAVKYRMISDVEVGSFLSGGVDSSLIAALGKVTHTWTAGMSEENEFSEASSTASFLNTEHTNLTIEPNEFLNLTNSMITTRKEPLSVPNEVLLFALSKQAKNRNSVLLSGEGADELFYGYSRIFSWANTTPKFDLAKFSEFYSYGDDVNLELVEDAVQPFLSRKQPFQIVAGFFQIAHLHGLLRRVDNSTMLASVEARVPFVDHRLVERMNGVSYESQTELGTSKSQLRRIAARYLPQQAATRPKVGFPVPLNKIMTKTESQHSQIVLGEYENWLRYNLKVLGYEK